MTRGPIGVIPRAMSVERLAERLSLGELLDTLKRGYGGWSLLHHWTRGELHHDLVLRVGERRDLPGDVLVVSTNCNGGVKEVLCFDREPSHDALWHYRCPDVPGLAAAPLEGLLTGARTLHWFDPCELLVPEARSELQPEHGPRQRGGGWEPKPTA